MLLYTDFPRWLSPVIIPGLPLRWYGMMYLVGFGLTWVLVRRLIRREMLPLQRAVSDDDLTNLFFWSIVGLLLGARFLAALLYDTTGRYLAQPWLIFWPFDGNGNFTGLQGMSYHGGLIGAVVAFIVYARVKRIPILEMGDIFTTAIPLGYTFGRLGNFINQELYGRITSSRWGMLFPHATPVPTSHPAVQEIAETTGIDIVGQSFINLPRHPSQLYEAALEGVVLWAIMWFVIRPHRPFRGFMIGVYLIGYALARFVAEFFRAPDPGIDFVIQWGPADNPNWLLLSPLNLTMGQLLSLLMAASGVAVLLFFRYLHKQQPRVETHETEDLSAARARANRKRRARARRK